MLKRIAVFDPAILSENIGDQIISQSIQNMLHSIFQNDFFISATTHNFLSLHAWLRINQCSYTFIGGSNLLSSNMQDALWRRSFQWRISLIDAFFAKNLVLLGTGWQDYQQNPSLYTSLLYGMLLSKKYIHSVRDSYAEAKLKSLNIQNVLNTSCPTLWNLTPEHCAGIPKNKSESVVFSLSPFKKDVQVDQSIFQLLKKKYRQIYFWIQGYADQEYMQKISQNDPSIIYLPPHLRDYETFLSNENTNIDYIGTRLHGGIKALQLQRKTLILSIDARSEEMKRDINLPVLSRHDLVEIERWIDSEQETQINLPIKNIETWKSQFKE